MKKTKGAVVGYMPGPPPADLPPSARQYLDEELNRIAAVLQALVTQSTAPLASLKLMPMSTPPATPVPSELIYTDGIAWDPGSGQGYYYWNGMVWTPLG